ncbi:MAG: ATP-binding cassette domain-containing protein [Actinobacteria bacterium]|nr:MAG: ATP-binding cassette domain-containing protein [Actinomycetota bacterium]
MLTPAESEQLFPTLREKVAIEGRCVALVSHKLAEVLHATDVITIMRQGHVIEHHKTHQTDARSLARAMVGREVSLRSHSAFLGASFDSQSFPSELATQIESTDVLQITDACVSLAGVSKLKSLNLGVRAGEILGLAGVEGNGQRELGDVLSSLLALDSGSISIDGTIVRSGKPGSMSRAGIAVIPEDRHDSGVVLSMSVAANLALQRMVDFTHSGVIDEAQLFENAQQLIDEFEIRCDGPNAPLHSLSGGNQQRVVLARELSAKPKVLVAAQPTRGLDVGAIEFMSDRLEKAAASGLAILLISSDLDEILHLSHRISVISSGVIVGTLSRQDATMEQLGLLMGGLAL